jgi:hypothetical protein
MIYFENLQEAIKNICSARNLCCKCGKAGHFIGDCNAVEYAQWMQLSDSA